MEILGGYPVEPPHPAGNWSSRVRPSLLAISRMPSPRGYCAALEQFTASLKKGEGESLAGYFISAMPGDLPRMLVRLPVAIPAKGLGAWIGYFHFAANRKLTQAHIDSGATCIAYETVELPSRELPLLTPMSEVAGRMAVQEGAKYLERVHGGRGLLLGGVPGVKPAKVVILGGGVVGSNAAKIAAGMGARVVILDVSLERLRYLSDVMPANVQLIFSNRHNVLEQIAAADLVIGGVLIPGATAPRLIRKDDLKIMRPGAVIVDVAIDQGGCVETIHATTHENPIYLVDGIIHYGVANMPGGVPRTSTLALTNATFPYLMELANKGWKQALRDNAALRKGLNIVDGKVTYHGVAEAFGFDFHEPENFVN